MPKPSSSPTRLCVLLDSARDVVTFEEPLLPMDATRSSGTELRSAWAGARTAVFDYIETFYNAVRFHSTLGYLSRVGYEKIKEEKAA